MSAVAVTDLWKYFGDFPALRQINFTVDEGCCLAVLGRNGAGKTTLLRILAGLSQPARGEVRIFGANVRDAATRSGIGVLGHGIAVYDELSAMENLVLFARLYGLSNPAVQAGKWLERTGLHHVRDSQVREFSRGMRQRLAVARVFLHEPRVFLLDEPFTALDDRAIAVLQDLLRDALREGRTILMSTHQIREAVELATHVGLVNRGRWVFHGERPDQMLTDPGWLYRTHGEA